MITQDVGFVKCFFVQDDHLFAFPQKLLFDLPIHHGRAFQIVRRQLECTAGHAEAFSGFRAGKLYRKRQASAQNTWMHKQIDCTGQILCRNDRSTVYNVDTKEEYFIK